MHRTTEFFWKCFNKLSPKIQKISKGQFNLLKSNKNHPSLHFKKVGKMWSIRISLDYRVLGIKDGDDFIWIWIGTHDEYKKMIKKSGL